MKRFIKLSCGLMDWKYHDFPDAVSLWVHLLMMANWKDGTYQGEVVPRGSMVTSMQNIQMQTGIGSDNTVRKWLRKFEADGMIERHSMRYKHTLITVMNYDKYQASCADDSAEENANVSANERANDHANESANTSANNSRNYRKDIKVEEKEKYIKRKNFVKPTIEELKAYSTEIGFFDFDAPTFYDYYESKGWMIGKNHMKDWKAAVRTWKRNRTEYAKPQAKGSIPLPEYMQHKELTQEEFNRILGIDDDKRQDG